MITSGHASPPPVQVVPSEKTKRPARNMRTGGVNSSQTFSGLVEENVHGKAETKNPRLNPVSGFVSKKPVTSKSSGSRNAQRIPVTKSDSRKRLRLSTNTHTGEKSAHRPAPRHHLARSHKNSVPALVLFGPAALNRALKQPGPKGSAREQGGHPDPVSGSAQALHPAAASETPFSKTTRIQPFSVTNRPKISSPEAAMGSQAAEAGLEGTSGPNRLVFVHRLKIPAKASRFPRILRRKPETASTGGTGARSRDISWGQTLNALSVDHGGSAPGEKVPAKGVQPTLAQAVQKGVLQRTAAKGWVIKPLNWRSPAGTNASKWFLTLPKQRGPLIMTLIHMQQSWKVELEVNSPTVAGALTDNLGQTSAMSAASLPVSQVSVFVGFGHNQPGQNGSSGSGGLPEPRNSSLPLEGQAGSQARLRPPVDWSSLRYSHIDYQA